LKVPAEDTRVSRRHCTIRRRNPSDIAPGSAAAPESAALDTVGSAGGGAILEDHSLNGTFVNGERVPSRGSRILRHGERVALARGGGGGDAAGGGGGEPEPDQTPEEDYVFTYLER
jgi:pSer/pThr/pTyr-binding forkhead associated (FHA) protein